MRRVLRRGAAMVLCFVLLVMSVPAGKARTAPGHILLVGLDRREGEAGGRADCVMVLSVSEEEPRLTVTSFLRDLYVPIPGHGSNRLNAAYALGGGKLLKKTMESLLDVPLKGYVAVDFGQFAQLIDTFGGIRLTLRADEARFINDSCGASLSEGEQRLTGQQALCYCRIRKLDADGDFSRTRRQQAVIRSAAEQLRGMGPGKMIGAIQCLMDGVTTDISAGELLRWVMELLPKMEKLRLTSLSIPVAGSFSDRKINEMAVLVADWKVNKRHFLEAVNGG